MAMPRFDIGSTFIEGIQSGRVDAMRRRELADAEEAAKWRAKLAPLQQAQQEYGVRGSILGTVQTPEDYAAALGEVQRLGLPTGDLPQNSQSQAWLTFKQPEAAQVAPSWMPERFRAPAMLPATQPAMPVGEMRAPGIAPEDIPRVQRAAERGLSLDKQQKFQDADLGRQLQKAQIAANLQKYGGQDEHRTLMRDLAERRFGLAETQAEQEARIADEKLALERRRVNVTERESARTAETSAPKIPGYELIPDATVDAASAKVARTAIGSMESLRDITKEFRQVYSRVKAGGPSARITGKDAQRLNAIRQRMLLNLKEAENLGVLQAVDIQTMEPLVPQAVGVGSMVRGAVGLSDPEVALEQFENEAYGRLGNVIESHGYRQIKAATGQSKPTASDAPYKFTKTYQGATYGRNAEGETWKLVK